MASILNTLEFSGRFKRDFKRVVKHPEFSIEDFEALLDDLIHLQPYRLFPAIGNTILKSAE